MKESFSQDESKLDSLSRKSSTLAVPLFEQEPLVKIYQVIIEKTQENADITDSSQQYKLLVKNLSQEKSYTINRDYQDFAWLYTALRVALPGHILPYFCSDSIVTALNKKLVYLNNRQRSIYLVSRMQELRHFMQNIVEHSVYGFTEELRIFLIEQREQFYKCKRSIDNHIQQLQTIQNNSQSIFSFLGRTISFFSSDKEKQIVWSKEWLYLKQAISNYSEQLYALTEKIVMMKHSKEDQIGWKGVSTQNDAIERLKVKILSAKPFTEVFIKEIEMKILVPLMDQCKKEGQLQKMINEKENLQKHITELKEGGNKEKLSRFQKRSEKFETYFQQSWNKYNAEWLKLMEGLDLKFKQFNDEYSRHLYKLWK